MTQSLRVVFAGTPEFAAAALAAVHAAGFAVPLVLTQPDRPAGRGMKLTASPVKRFALEQGMTVAQPTSLRRNGKYPEDATSGDRLLRATPHDVMVVAAYGLILPQEVLDIAPHGLRSTFTRRCCRAGVALRRSIARSKPATPKPASR